MAFLPCGLTNFDWRGLLPGVGNLQAVKEIV